MDELQDPLLKEQLSVSAPGLEYAFVNLPRSIIETVNANIQLVWVMKNLTKTITPEEIIVNAQKMFSSNEIKANDALWKEHCAATLRELVDKHFQQNCLFILRLVANRNDSEQAQNICDQLQGYKDFFNDFSHLRHTAKEQAAKLLGTGLDEIDEQAFDKLCTRYILVLDAYFKFKAK